MIESRWIVRRIKELFLSFHKMSWKCALQHSPASKQPRNIKLRVLWMKFGVMFWHWSLSFYCCATILSCGIFCTQTTTLHTPSPSTFIHLTCSACQLDALQFAPPAVRRVSSPGTSTSFPQSEVFTASRLQKKFTTGHCSCYWHSCFFTHSYREAATISLTWKSNSASPLNPMRQKAEKEAETNRLRSSCTLDRRHECCQWHYLVFSHKVIIIYIHNVQFIEI